MITKASFQVTNYISLTALIALAAIPALSTATEEQAPVLQRAVSHRNLDLDTDRGARAFYSRLRTAALSVCYATESVMPGSYSSENPCVKKAIGDAVRSVNRPNLTQLFVAAYRSDPQQSKPNVAIASAAGD
jgi:UrcA family protein